MIYPKDYVVWDLETSGLDPATDKILEIGAMKVVNGEIVKQKNWVLNHSIDIPPEITQLTGITKEIVEAEGVDPARAMDEFIAGFVLSSAANLTHNGYRFDIPFFIRQAADILPLSLSELEDLREKIKSAAPPAAFQTARPEAFTPGRP